jgi:hypothetical protein
MEQQPKLADEMRKMHAEPLLPIEKKLISWSLGLGIVLLVVLVAISRMFMHT